MPIYGLTHRPDGKLIQQFAVDLKVSIGKPPDANRNYPTKLDHFFFTTKNSKGEWTEDKQLTEKLQEKYSKKVITEKDHKEIYTPVREFEIFFLSDDIDEIFRTNYEWWTKSECRCRGNGLEAERSVLALSPQQLTEMNIDPRKIRRVPWKPCGVGCPELANKLCKAHGTLHFTLIDRPNIGSVAVYYTTSPKTIRQIGSSLDQIKTLTGGRLKGIKFSLRLKPGKARHPDPKQPDKLIVSTAYFVHIEFKESDFKNFFNRLMIESVQYDKARLLQAAEARALPAAGEVTGEIIQLSEREQAAIIGPEFHPETAETGSEDDVPPDWQDPESIDDDGTAPADPAVSAQVEKANQFEKEFKECAERLQLNQTKQDFILGRFGGDFESSRNFLGRFLKYVVEMAITVAQADEYLKRGIVNEPWLWDTMEAELKKFREAKAQKEQKEQKESTAAGKKKTAKPKPEPTTAEAAAAAAAPTPVPQKDPVAPPTTAPASEDPGPLEPPPNDQDWQGW